MTATNNQTARPACPKCGARYLRDGSCLLCGCVVRIHDHHPERRCPGCGRFAVFSGGVCPACAQRGVNWQDVCLQDTPPGHARSGTAPDRAAFDAAQEKRREREREYREKYEQLRKSRRERERKRKLSWAHLSDEERLRRERQYQQQREYRSRPEIRKKRNEQKRAYYAQNREAICAKQRARRARQAAEASDG